MRRKSAKGLLASFIATLFFAFSPCIARADKPFDNQMWRFFSSTENILYLGAGVGMPLVLDGSSGTQHALRIADAMGTGVLLCEGIKALVREKRPDSNAHDSFPSGHATAAFAVATAASALHPSQTPFWFAGATLIAASRVGLHRHTVGDVLFGAALGYGVARWEIASPRGLLLFPWIRPERHTMGIALQTPF